LNRFSEQHGRLFQPRFQDVVGNDVTLRGTFLGNGLFVPSDAEIPRGRISLCIYRGGKFDATAAPRQEFSAVFGGDDRVAAGFYATQDRAVIGFGNGLPIGFDFNSAAERQEFRPDTVLAILPASPENPKPRLLSTRMSTSTAEFLSMSQEAAANTIGAEEPHSILAKEAQADDRLVELNFDDVTGAAWCPLMHISQGGSSGSTYALRVEPNTAVARLRHTPPEDVDNFFSVIGLLVPSPVGKNNCSEACLNFRSDGHLIGHPLDALASATLLRPANDMLARVRRIFDEAVLADASGITGFTRLRDDRDPTAAGPHHQYLLLSDRKNLGLKVENPLHQSMEGGIIASFGRLKQYYLVTPRAPEAVMGYFASPTRHSIEKNQVEADRTQRISRAAVSFSRASAPKGEGCCLDWLDEAIQVAYSPTGSREEPEPMGFARFWNETRKGLEGSARADQSLELFTRPQDRGSYRLSLVERSDDREERTMLLQGSVVRLGPLICRYHHRGGD
ncbi:MAG: hypothetical protein AAF761_09865, partial [Pseudomonadota bacterium]